MYYIMKILLLLLVIFYATLHTPTAHACAVKKPELWQCLLKRGDLNHDNVLTESELRKVIGDNTAWYERLIKSPDTIIRQAKSHCGIPMTPIGFFSKTCFRHCGGLDGKKTVMDRLCPS